MSIAKIQDLQDTLKNELHKLTIFIFLTRGRPQSETRKIANITHKKSFSKRKKSFDLITSEQLSLSESTKYLMRPISISFFRTPLFAHLKLFWRGAIKIETTFLIRLVFILSLASN